MRATGRTPGLALLLLVLAGSALGQNRESGNLAEVQRAPTVLGGTGLFNTFSTRTLYRGEFSFAIFWNRFDRDPGDLRIDQAPFNFTVGLTNRWELWVDWITYQRVRSSNPPLLSGYQYNALRFFGDPFDVLGPPAGGRNGGTAFFPGTAAPTGGILPRLGLYGQPIALGGSVVSPGGPNGRSVVGLGPAIIVNVPNYFNDLPFYGVVDFLGFDSLGRPVLGTRQRADGSGDFYFGTKVSLIDPNKHWFSIALGGYAKVPISTDDQALARGRTNGQYEYGPMLMLGQETKGKRARFYENIGYIHTADVEEHGIKALDLRDKLLANFGMSIALERHVEFVGEILHTRYVGSGTPGLQLNDPVDLNVGLRFFFLRGAISFGGAYRRFLNSEGSTTLQVLDCSPAALGGSIKPQGPPPPPPCVPRSIRFGDGDSNGFVGFFTIGRRKECPAPPVPTCMIETSSSVVNRGDPLTLTMRPSTLGYADAKLSYTYRWQVRDSQGRPVTVSGTGASVQVSTGRLSCGTYSVNATVMVTAASVDHPDGCVTTGQTNCDAKFEVTEPPCPPVTCSIVASATRVTEGDRVTLRAQVAGGGTDLNYAWSCTGGRLSVSSGQQVTLFTGGISGPVTVRCSVTTDRTRCDQSCPGTTCSIPITVDALPPPPGRPGILRPCGPIFFAASSARVTNEHKACLDQVALTLQQDPRSSLVIDGHRDASEIVGISLSRANNARDYLIGEKAIASARITVRNFGDTCPHDSGDINLNRRVELWVVPAGASVADVVASKRCARGSAPRVITDEQPASPVERKPPPRAPRKGVKSRSTGETEELNPAASRPRIAQPQRESSPATRRIEAVRESDRGVASVGTLRHVRVQGSGGGSFLIHVDTDAPVAYRDFTLSAPSRIVVDLTDVQNAFEQRTLWVQAGIVERVRVGEPESGIVRIVIDLKTMTSYRIVREGNSLVILVGGQDTSAKADH